MANYIKRAIKDVAEFNAQLAQQRREERCSYFDMQTQVRSGFLCPLGIVHSPSPAVSIKLSNSLYTEFIMAEHAERVWVEHMKARLIGFERKQRQSMDFKKYYL